MFSRAFSKAASSGVNKSITLFQMRAFHTPAPARKWVQTYDKAIVEKYPNVLKVINNECSVNQLTSTERAAYFVATYKTGCNGGHKLRQKARQLNFESKVDALVNTWRGAEFLQRKQAHRANIIKKAKSQRLSSYQKDVNAFTAII